MASSEIYLLPKINLLCRFDSASEAFKQAVDKYYPELHQQTEITIHKCSLATLSDKVRFDAIVSPANSYGFMDGAFDDAISILLSPNPREGYGWTTKKVQKALYRKWRGYAPPGSCTIIDVQRDDAWHEIKTNEEQVDRSKPSIMQKLVGSSQQELNAPADHKHVCKFIALCPTMRVPQNVRSDREVVFECVWSLLCAIDAHNIATEDPALHIKSILMTPLATGVGRVSDAKWAAQCVLAIKCWVQAVQDPEKWSKPHWNDTDSGNWGLLASTEDL